MRLRWSRRNRDVSVDRIAGRVGLRRHVRLLQFEGLNAPVAFGLLRPTVLLPVGFGDRFSPVEQEAVLAHELAHLAARDPLWQLLAELCCAALWWHPAAWWLRLRLRAANEAAADEASLLVPGGPDALAGCLVALGRGLASPRAYGWISFEGNGFRSGLGQRVERLLNLKARADRGPARRGLKSARAIVVVLLVIVSVLSTAWRGPSAFEEEGESQMSGWQSSWRRSLAATVLAACWASASPAAEGPSILIEASKAPVQPPVVVQQDGQNMRVEVRAVETKPGEKPNVFYFQTTEPIAAGTGTITVTGSGAVSPEDRQRLEKEIAELVASARELNRAGKTRASQAVAQEAERLRRQLAGPTTVTAAGGMGGGVTAPGLNLTPEERERRMKHLKAAVEELRQAGLNVQADAMARMGEAMLQGQPMPGVVTGRAFGATGGPIMLGVPGGPITAFPVPPNVTAAAPLPWRRGPGDPRNAAANADAPAADYRVARPAQFAESAAARRGAKGRTGRPVQTHAMVCRTPIRHAARPRQPTRPHGDSKRLARPLAAGFCGCSARPLVAGLDVREADPLDALRRQQFAERGIDQCGEFFGRLGTTEETPVLGTCPHPWPLSQRERGRGAWPLSQRERGRIRWVNGDLRDPLGQRAEDAA